MEVKVERVSGIDLVRKACGVTISKESKITLDEIYRCRHSPIRCSIFWVELKNIPTFASVHLVRHSQGITHFVKSNREDRIGYTGDTGRDHPVNHCMLINAEALLNLAEKRLCGKTHDVTVAIVQAIKDEIEKIDPDLARYMVRQCEYRNGICPERKCCGNLYIAK